MDFEQIKAFYITAKEKNFHKAAEILHISQPAISKRIANLEQTLQVALFEREGKKINLTHFGEILVDYAERILSLSEEAASAITFAHEREKNYINIGTTSQISINILPNLLKQFHNTFPNIDINLETNHSRKLMELVEDGLIHVGMVSMRPPEQYYESILLEQDAIILASSPEHSLYHQFNKYHTLSSDAFNQTIVINFRPSTSYYRSLFELFDQYQIQPKQNITVDTVEAMKRMAISNLGVAFFPRMTIQKEINEGTLVEIPFLTNHSIKAETFMIYRKHRYLNLAAQNFLTFTKEYFRIIKTGGNRSD